MTDVIKDVSDFIRYELTRRESIKLNFKIVDVQRLKDLTTITVAITSEEPKNNFYMKYDIKREYEQKFNPIERAMIDIQNKIAEYKEKKYKYVVDKNSITIKRFLEVV